MGGVELEGGELTFLGLGPVVLGLLRSSQGDSRMVLDTAWMCLGQCQPCLDVWLVLGMGVLPIG